MSFDPYLNWLGIPPHEQPPSYYRLLGVVIFESNPEVLDQAADRQSLRVGAYQGGPQDELCQRLLSEIAMAKFCLMDPQQKSAYDGQLQQTLEQRGERVVAPPPPAWSADAGQSAPSPAQFGPQAPQFGLQAPQFGPQPPQFGSQALQFDVQGMGSFNSGQAAPGPGQGPMTMPSPPMQAPMPDAAAMSATFGMQTPPAMQAPPPMQGFAAMPLSPAPQPAMPMPPAAMPGPISFAPAMPQPTALAAVPMAAPFPVATAAVAARPAPPIAPPAMPPAAPQRPLDELESLTARPTTRRRIVKKPKVDHTKEIIIGSIVAAAAIILLVAYAFNHKPAGYGGIPEDIKAKQSHENFRAKHAEDLKKEQEAIKAKEKEKVKEQEEKANKAAGHTAPDSGKSGALRPFSPAAGQSTRTSPAADDGDSTIVAPYKFGPPSRSMDSPDPGGHVDVAPRPAEHDVAPQDLGGANDPVMGEDPVGMPKPTEK